MSNEKSPWEHPTKDLVVNLRTTLSRPEYKPETIEEILKDYRTGNPSQNRKPLNDREILGALGNFLWALVAVIEIDHEIIHSWRDNDVRRALLSGAELEIFSADLYFGRSEISNPGLDTEIETLKIFMKNLKERKTHNVESSGRSKEAPPCVL